MTEPCLSGKHSYAKLAEELFASLGGKGPSAALNVIDRYLGRERYTIKDLFKDEQEELLKIVLQGEIEYVGKILEEVYTRTAFLTAILEECGHRIPGPFTVAAEVTLKRKLINALESQKSTPDTIRLLLDEISRWCIAMDHEWLERTLRASIDQEMAAVRLDPRCATLKQTNAKLSMLYLFPVQVNLWQAQNVYFDLLRSCYPDQKKAADNGDAEAGRWLDEFMRLGTGLFINVENVLAATARNEETETETGGKA